MKDAFFDEIDSRFIFFRAKVNLNPYYGIYIDTGEIMVWTDLAVIGRWVKGLEPVLPLLATFLSVAILFGCAVASWVAPSEKKDRLFHREVI